MDKKETIYYSNNEFIEKIAHESAMASAISEFNRKFNCDMVKPTREPDYIINLYYQHKERVLNEIIKKYDCKLFDRR